jgi:hypothetical protein
VNSNTWHLICNNFNLNFIFGTVCLCVCLRILASSRIPDMILGDKSLISEVVLSHALTLRYHCRWKSYSSFLRLGLRSFFLCSRSRRQPGPRELFFVYRWLLTHRESQDSCSSFWFRSAAHARSQFFRCEFLLPGLCFSRRFSFVRYVRADPGASVAAARLSSAHLPLLPSELSFISFVLRWISRWLRSSFPFHEQLTTVDFLHRSSCFSLVDSMVHSAKPRQLLYTIFSIW